MTEVERKELLRQARQLLDKRKKDRTPCLIPAHYNIMEGFYSSFILDINKFGAFIETDRRFTAGQDIMLQYFDPFSRKSSELKGEIVWSSDDGIGVKFNYFLYSPF
jgi:Tfp pilus assembly protein PilZ